MSTIDIDRKLCRQLETMLELWGTPLPEVLPRQRLWVGQCEAKFAVSARAIFTAFGMFSLRTGGNLVWPCRVNPPIVHVNKWDTIIYRFNWQQTGQ